MTFHAGVAINKVLLWTTTMMSNDALRDCSNTASQSSMENSQQRKRPASPLNNDEAKKSRPNANDDKSADDASESIAAAQSSTLPENDNFSDSSIEGLLTVPLEYIFRQVPGAAPSKRKPLLTRAEAQCLVKASQLAHEVDAIVQVSSNALSRQVWCRSFSQSIQQVPLLRSVLPALSVHGNDIASHVLHHVQGELDRVLQELEMCAAALRQYSEQNWTLAESLMDAFGDAPSSGQELAREKRIIAEIEEEVCARIDRLLTMSSTQDAGDEIDHVKDAFEQATDETSGQFVSMQLFCNRLFGNDSDTSAESAAVHQEDVAAAEDKGSNDDNPSNTKGTRDKGPNDSQDAADPALQERSMANDQPNNPLLALANEAEEREQHSQWSGSTVTIKTPERSSLVDEDSDDEEEYELTSMTQGTSNAVAALTVMASGGRRDSQRMDDGDD